MLRWTRLWTSALGSALPRVLAVAALALVTALVTVSAPRVISRASYDALRGELAGASPASRDLELVQLGRIPANGSPSTTDPLGPVVAAGTALQAAYPAPIAEVVSGTGLAIDTPHWRTTAGKGLTAVLRLRVQQDVEAHLTLVTGRQPTAATALVPDPTPDAPPGSLMYVLEAAVSAPAADALAVKAGDRLILDPEPSDPLAAHRSLRIAIDIVGTYRVTDPADPYWIDDAEVGRPGIYALAGFTEYVSAMALLSPSAYPSLLDITGIAQLPLSYRFRSYVDPGAVDAASVAELADAVRRARSIYPPVSDTPVIGADGVAPASLSTGLLALLDGHIARWATASGVLIAAWAGVLLTILASLVLVAEAVARSRRAAMALVRDRGATRPQTAAAAVADALALAAPGALAGTALAALLVPASDPAPTAAVAAGVLALFVTLMAAAALRPDRVRAPSRGPGATPRVVALVVAGLAIAGAFLLRQPTAADTTPLAADPALAGVPALLGLAAALALASAVGPVARAAAARAARRRGLAAVLGLRRAVGTGPALLLVALATTGALTFAASVAGRLDGATAWASWQAVGADAAITGRPPQVEAVVASPPQGVDATASVATAQVSVGGAGQVTAIVVDPAAVAAVSARTPAAIAFPAEMLAGERGALAVLASPGALGAPAAGPGASPAASPASAAPAAGPGGQTITIRVGSKDVAASVAGELDAFPGVPVSGPFVVIARGQLEALGLQAPAPTIGLLRATPAGIDGLRAAIAGDAALGGLGLTVRAEEAARLLASPAVSAVGTGLRVGALVVLPYGALTIVLAVALAAAARRPETARARVLGMSRRQSVQAALVEAMPAVVVGAVAGVLLGPLILAVTGPGLGLEAVLGVPDLGPAVGPLGAVAPGAAAGLVLALAVALVCVLVDQRPTLTEVLRE